MKIRYLFLLLAFGINTSWADFSNTEVITHPVHPSSVHNRRLNSPYIIELIGEWSTDCHPGEQKPVISEYSGDSVLIEFEIIVEHATCNEVITPYRVLVDMSDVYGDFETRFTEIEVTVRFDGAEQKDVIPLTCIICSPPLPPLPPTNPEAGLYFSTGLEKQGLLLARQNQRVGAYPLIYDESGSSEWLLGPGGVVEDVFFAELFEFTGGQCLGCVPPGEPTQVGSVGKLSMLIDKEGLIQVRINDGLFKPYELIEFGYGGFEIVDAEDERPVKVPDLSGRWAFAESYGPDDVMIGSPTSVVPLVFDIALRSDIDPTPPDESVLYSILNIEGEEVAQMDCEYRDGAVCNLRSPTMENEDSWFLVNMLSIERMLITNTVPFQVHEGIPIDYQSGHGTAVRID